MKLRLIVNPKAGSGRALRCLPEVEAQLRNAGLDYRVSLTQAPNDATRLARDARDSGDTCIAVMGGDGTLNEVAQAYIDETGTLIPGPELGLLPAGTGGDFRKTFGLGDSIAEAVRRLIDTPPRELDLGVVRLTSDSDQPVTRAFLNIMSFGIGGLTDRIVNQGPKWIGGKAAFFLGTLRAMIAYRNAPVVVHVDGKPCLEAPVFNVAVANGRFFGGGMQIAPEADPSDGLLDVVALYDLTRAQGIGLAYHVYRGAHLGQKGVLAARGSRITAEPTRSGAEVLIDLDGETPGKLPLEAWIVKGALRLRA